MTITFTVPGDPVGWQRAGVNRYTGHHYTQEKTRYREQEIALAYRIKAHGFMFPQKRPLKLKVIAFFPIPKRATKAERTEMLCCNILPTIKPDWDNLGKIMDALNGIAWHDDKDIVFGEVIKVYSVDPRTEITITDSFTLPFQNDK